MGKPEGKIENYLIQQTKKFGYMQRKTASPSNAGFPDRLVIGNGYTVFVELKAITGHPSELQKVTIREMRKHGAIVYIIDTKEDCLKLLEHMRDKTLSQFTPTCRHNSLTDKPAPKSPHSQ